MFHAQLAMDQTLNAWHPGFASANGHSSSKIWFCLKGTPKSHGKLGTQPSLLTPWGYPSKFHQGSTGILGPGLPRCCTLQHRQQEKSSQSPVALQVGPGRLEDANLRYTDVFFPHQKKSPKNGWDKVWLDSGRDVSIHYVTWIMYLRVLEHVRAHKEG